MIINIDEFKETLELNRSEIAHNQSLTNEYLIDDIMSQLGYNKRRNKDVKRLFDKPIDWEVLSTGSPKLAVKVFALDDEMNSDEVQSAMEYCKGKLFSILVLTNGETLNVYRYNKVKREYTSVCEIKLTDELSELSESVLEAISNNGFDTGKIDEIISKLSVSPEKVRDTMLDNVGMLANQVAAWMGDSGNSFIEQCKTVIEGLISVENSSNAEQSENTVASEVPETSNEELSELQAKLAEATTKADEQSKTIDEQQKEIDILKNSNDELKSQLDEAKEQKTATPELDEATTNIINNLSAEVTDKDAKIEQQQKELEELKSDNEEQQKELDKLKNNNEDLKSQLDEQSKKLEEIKEHEISTSEVEELNNKINGLSAEVNEKDAHISELETEINTKNTLLEAKETLINEKDAEIAEKVAELEKASSNSGVSSTGSVASQDEIDSYREQIQTISSKLADSEDKIRQLTKELEDANCKLNNISGAERQKATELINVIEDSSELPRSYVAVINTELLQYDTLHTFVGRTLQKLYEIKSYEASQFIFNGDIFKIVQPAERNDLIMNNKAYDIKLDGIHEDEVLNKLRIVFSHFSDIVFECKKIGSLEVTEKMAEESNSSNEASNSDAGIDTGIKFDSIDDIDTDNNNEAGVDFDNNTENINFGDDSSEASNGAGVNLNKADDFGEQQSKKLHGIMCGQFLQLDDLIWGDEETVFNTIKYIGSSSVNFNINMNNDDMSNERLFCKSLDAMLALAILNGQNNVLSLLRQTDLSQINNFIKLYTEEYASYPGATRINGTRYIVAGIESVKQVASVLADVGNNLGIDMSDMFVFFDADTTSEQMLDTWGYNESAIQLNENTDVSGIPDEKDAIAVLNGGIFNNLIITKNSLSVHEKVIGRTLRIKTKYFRHIMENPDNPGDDVALTVREMINEAVKMGRHDINFNCLGNVIGESYKLVSENISDVSEDAIQIEADGKVLYVSRLKNWQVPLSLIKVHTTLLANTAVAIKVEVNSEALNFYMNQFVVAEPSFSLAVESFTRYINSCIK